MPLLAAAALYTTKAASAHMALTITAPTVAKGAVVAATATASAKTGAVAATSLASKTGAAAAAKKAAATSVAASKAAPGVEVIKVAEIGKLRQADIVATLHAAQMHNATLAGGPAQAGVNGISFHFHVLQDGMVHFAEDVTPIIA